MAIVSIKIPEKVKELFPTSHMDVQISFIREVPRQKEIDYFYERTSEEFVEKIFLLFSPNPDLDSFREILEEVYRVSLEYNKSLNFKNMAHKKEDQLSEDEKEMYFTEEAHLNTASVLFCSWLLIPLMDAKGGKITKHNYRRFWSFFREVNTVDIEGKVEKIVQGRFLASEADSRFWAVAEMYGETKLSWLIRTITNLTTKDLIKIRIGENFAIYSQVIAKDSLAFLTRKNFTFPLSLSASTRIVQENPDSFMSSLILEEELLRYVKKNPDTLEIDCDTAFPRYIRLLCLVVLDKLFNVSADLFIRTSKDTYYACLVKQVCIHYLESIGLQNLADAVYSSLPQQEVAVSNYKRFKTGQDAIFDEKYNLFCKSITDHIPPEASSLVKNDLVKFIYEQHEHI